MGQPLLLTEGVGTRPVSEQSREHRGFRSRLVADASGAPVLREQGPIGRPGTARPMQASRRLAGYLSGERCGAGLVFAECGYRDKA